jgi:hypothetical protein
MAEQTESRPGPGRVPRYLTIGWVLLLLLALFPFLSVATDLVADLGAGIPSDHRATFASLAGMPWSGAQQASPGITRYITLLEIGYAVHELVFAVFFLVILAIPFRRRERWAWWSCWALLVADVGYSLTFGRYDRVILTRSLIVDVALPVLLLLQVGRFFRVQRPG